MQSLPGTEPIGQKREKYLRFACPKLINISQPCDRKRLGGARSQQSTRASLIDLSPSAYASGGGINLNANFLYAPRPDDDDAEQF